MMHGKEWVERTVKRSFQHLDLYVRRSAQMGVEMQGYIGIIMFASFILMVLVRVNRLKRKGIKAMQFGEMDKKDFLIPPFVLFYIYLLIANAFALPRPHTDIFQNEVISWLGVLFCGVAVVIFLLALLSFGKSFRVGLDEVNPGELITTGIFAISRNPIYTAFGIMLTGIFWIYPDWLFFIYMCVGIWLFNRQIRLEEKSLEKIYGNKYREYCKKVRRFL